MVSKLEETVAQPRLLTIKAAAYYLSVTPWFMRSLVYGKALPSLRLGNRIVFDRVDLDAFVEAAKAGGRK